MGPDIVSRVGEFLGVISVKRVLKDLLVESVNVDDPEVFNMREVLLAQAVLANRDGKHKRVEVLSEKSVRAEKITVLAEDWEDDTAASKLVDREPRSCGENQTVAEAIFSIPLELHLRSADGLLICVELAKRFELALDVKQAECFIPPALRCLVLQTFIVTTVDIILRKRVKVLTSQLLVVLLENHLKRVRKRPTLTE